MLTKYYQLNFLKPTLHSEPLTDGPVATVPIFDVKTLLIAFLIDPLRMRQENFASKPTSTLDEIHSGSLWEQARQKYCGDDPYAFLLALVCFYDKKNWCIWFTFMCTIHLYTIIFEQRLTQWWLKLHGFGLYPQSWIWKRKGKKTDSWDEITGRTQLFVIHHQSNY